VHFQAEHRFPAPVAAVMAVLADPAFHAGLQLPDLELDEIVDHRDDGNAAIVLLRYAYVGHVDAVVQRLLGGRRLTWLQELALDRAASEGRLSVSSDSHRDRLQGAAQFSFVPEGHDTVRELAGEIRVSVPLIAAKAERRIVGGFLRRLDAEAAQLTERLRS
jgi:hypothetical protein